LRACGTSGAGIAKINFLSKNSSKIKRSFLSQKQIEDLETEWSPESLPEIYRTLEQQIESQWACAKTQTVDSGR